MIELNNPIDEVPVKWRFRTDPWLCSFGVSGLSAPPGSYPMLEGVDGRVQGCLRRYLGHLLLYDLKASIIDPTANNFRDAWLDNKDAIEQVIPFEIVKGQTAYRLRGFVIRHRALHVHLNASQAPYSREWYEEDAIAHSP